MGKCKSRRALRNPPLEKKMKNVSLLLAYFFKTRKIPKRKKEGSEEGEKEGMCLKNVEKQNCSGKELVVQWGREGEERF